MKYSVKRVSLTCAAVGHKFQLHHKKVLKRRLHVSMYGKSGNNNNNNNSNANNNNTNTNASYSEEIMFLQKAQAIFESVKKLIENTCGKKCLGLTKEDATFVNQNIICNDNFRKTVMCNVNNLQFYFFPKLGVNNLKDYIAVIYKYKNNNFATTYFSVLA